MGDRSSNRDTLEYRQNVKKVGRRDGQRKEREKGRSKRESRDEEGRGRKGRTY